MIRIVIAFLMYLVSLLTFSQSKLEKDKQQAFQLKQENKLATIKVNVPNVTSDKGTVHFALFDKDTFMLNPLMSKTGKINNGYTEIIFNDVKPGLYAIICFHDRNNNSKLDFDELRMPIEDYGISNNPVLMGPPTFDMAKFIVENKSLDLTINF